jgi:hypothetical protein
MVLSPCLSSSLVSAATHAERARLSFILPDAELFKLMILGFSAAPGDADWFLLMSAATCVWLYIW